MTKFRYRHVCHLADILNVPPSTIGAVCFTICASVPIKDMIEGS